MFTLRFDLRSATGGAPQPDLYAAAVEMCAWAETRGAVVAVLSEHHGTDDGHLAAPHLLAAAIAARTRTLQILAAAVPLPFWDPVRLAEEICALDILSRGRVSFAFGIGHRDEEYVHFGVDRARRGQLADQRLDLVLRLVRGEATDIDGRTVRVTPPCTTPGGPRILVAGGSAPAVRRAARHGLGLICQTASPELRDLFDAECRRHGHPPGFAQFPVPGAPTAVFVAEDVDRAWSELGPYLLHDAVTAASYRHGDDGVASISRARTVAELRAEAGPYRILTPAEAAEHTRAGGLLPLLPLCGGIPPDVAWPYLECAAAVG
ncbi:LLM class flavin-dependent oxidoreductase [Mycobacterium sp. GA-2829]|uniref:LLM class flavin-dependent oxidoreductase n=1 Tax=Mycobacterium sp. GA-2829 TaxID=1772283 RepID=UPI00073FEFAB|nr:LLM class flavin-dependent oxidoreductase [Mycobacterium sp. GA-2829]KUI26889.1 luciferase [Mycobacterium sp. GA-2829]